MPQMDGFTLAEEISRHPKLAGSVIMMLSSSDHPGDPERCRRLGVARYLTKPVKQSDLRQAILEALAARDAQRPAPTAVAAPAPSSVPVGPAPHWHILLAEDNVINQKVALQMLRKRGHTVVVAGSGKEVLQLLEQQSFDVVLMDVQMPDMDGLQTTELIRAQEKETGRHVPIVAMTGHAMKGDRERCLEAGMDDYLAKPIQARELFEILARVVPVQSHSATAFDAERAWEQVGGDRDLLREVAQVFLDQYPSWLDDVRAALTAQDGKALQRAAHSLKGAAGAMGASPVFTAALRLEKIGRDGALEGAADACAALQTELLNLQQALTELLAGAAAGCEPRGSRCQTAD